MFSPICVFTQVEYTACKNTFTRPIHDVVSFQQTGCYYYKTRLKRINVSSHGYFVAFKIIPLLYFFLVV